MAAAVEIIEPPTPRLPDADAIPTNARPELELAVTLHLGTAALEVARLRASDVVALADFEASPTLGAATELIAALRARGARLSRKPVDGAEPKVAAFQSPGGHRSLRAKRETTLDKVRARLRSGPVTGEELIAEGTCRHAAHVRGVIQYLRKQGACIELIGSAYTLKEDAS